MIGSNGSTLNMFQIYVGNGLLMLAFAVSLVFLFVMENEKEKKAILVYASFVLLALFFFPPFANLWMYTLKEEPTYYRFLWMLPEAIVCGYALIRFLELVKWKWLKIIITLIVTICVMIGGNLVYNSPVFTKAENLYQVPQSVVDICDEIVIPGREVKAVFPNEILPYVRQYTALILMPYGYETLVDRWGFQNDIFDEMNQDISNSERLAELCIADGCHYIILNKNHLLDGALEDYGFLPTFESGDYLAYKNTYGDFFVPEMD